MVNLNSLERLSAFDRQRILVHLYVTGDHARSQEAILTMHQLCEGEFGGQFELITIDLRSHPHEADAKQILVTPTLMRVFPGPERRLIGEFADPSAMRSALQLWLEEVECRLES